jgi:lysophospholipase L1-like esterase
MKVPNLVLVAALVAWGCGGSETGVARQSSTIAAPGAAANPPVYLALGDSIPFGLDPAVLPPETANWFVGYPRHLAELIDIPHVNAACPGETSAGFLSMERADYKCRPFRESYELHVEYPGSQLEYAVGFVAKHSRLRLVTIALGSNDLYKLRDDCGGDLGCVTAALPGVLTDVGANVSAALWSLRAAGYAGQVVVPLYYSPSPDPFTTAAISYLNGVLRDVAQAFDADVADVFTAFQARGPDACAAGLLIAVEGGCDAHPGEAGARLIAEEIAKLIPPRSE